jgi:hypothetical protein
LLKYTVATALKIKLINLAVQPVDGTKISANCTRDRNYDISELERLLERAEKAILEMEAQNESGEAPSLPATQYIFVDYVKQSSELTMKLNLDMVRSQ